ncbi:MAG: hypothetical protein JO104_04455 [Candidatus Eremiobacteraeota bacterium]|nr:hypothetical protein [Candidatus Eremiobacteraeota bacterium]
MRKLPLLLSLLAGPLTGCAQMPGAHGIAQAPPSAAVATQTAASQEAAMPQDTGDRRLLGNGKIKHVVIIFQENRSTDNLFNGLPGADTQPYGLNSNGDRIQLQPIRLTGPYDIDHSHVSFETAFDGGRMDGFNLERSSEHCLVRHGCPSKATRAYAFVPRDEVKPYFDMAEEYAFGDRMFASQAGPSFPAHQYILSGESTIAPGSPLRASENPLTPEQHFTGGCDSPSGSLVTLIDAEGTEDQEVYPCFDRPALTALLEAKGLTWHYYQAHLGAGLWNAPDAIRRVRYGSHFSTDVVGPPSQVLYDVKHGTLANVVWVTPTAEASDHAGVTDGTGPSWVASVVNTIGESQYWDSTAVLVTWDDWGGWYDHVKPLQYNSYELGFRVPLIVISAYAKKAYVSHRRHEFGSLLKFTEKALGLKSLGTTDARADDLADCFNFAGKPRRFTPIASRLGPDYFLRQPVSARDPDDDF